MSVILRLIAVALAMSAVLVALVGAHVARRAGGQEIYLDMAPVDPRDILLGHYVVLTTDLHRLDTGALDGPETGWTRGDVVHVALRQTETGSMAPTGAFREPPVAPFIQGRVSQAYETHDFTEPEPMEDGSPGFVREPVEDTQRQELQVRYNLERYYAAKQQALALESMRNDDRLRLIVSLSAEGRAVIKGLEIDGEAEYDTLF